MKKIYKPNLSIYILLLLLSIMTTPFIVKLVRTEDFFVIITGVIINLIFCTASSIYLSTFFLKSIFGMFDSFEEIGTYMSKKAAKIMQPTFLILFLLYYLFINFKIVFAQNLDEYTFFIATLCPCFLLYFYSLNILVGKKFILYHNYVIKIDEIEKITIKNNYLTITSKNPKQRPFSFITKKPQEVYTALQNKINLSN